MTRDQRRVIALSLMLFLSGILNIVQASELERARQLREQQALQLEQAVRGLGSDVKRQRELDKQVLDRLDLDKQMYDRLAKP